MVNLVRKNMYIHTFVHTHICISILSKWNNIELKQNLSRTIYSWFLDIPVFFKYSVKEPGNF
jgi:hypothetical protein